MKPKLGEILVRAGVVDPAQLRSALGEQRRWGRRLGQTLLSMGVLSERDLVRALASQLGIPVVNLAGKSVEAEILQLIPVELAEKHRILPLFVKHVEGLATLFLGVEDPTDVEAIDDARFQCGMSISPIMVGPTELGKAIARCYPDACAPSAEDQAWSPREVMLEQMADDAASKDPVSIEDESDSVAAEVVLHEELRRVGGTELLKALAQLLVEHRILQADEITERIRALRRAEEPA